MKKNLFIAFILIGFFLILGSVGAMENENISELQCILQSMVGFALCIPYVLYEHRMGG